MDHHEFPHCGWKKGNNHIPTISPKSFPTCLNLSTVFFLNDPREFLPECRVFLPNFFAKKTGKMSQCASNVRTCSKIILKNLTIHLGAPNRSHQTCSGLWAPAPGHILRSAHVPTFTVPFQFLNAFKLKQELSGENVHELNSCLQISYRNSRLNWISRLQSIYLPDCEKVYFLCSAQNISLNGDLGIDGPLMSGDFPWLRCQRLGFLSLQIGLPHFSWWERSFLAQNNIIYIYIIYYIPIDVTEGLVFCPLVQICLFNPFYLTGVFWLLERSIITDVV